MTGDDFLKTMGWLMCYVLAVALVLLVVVGATAVAECGGRVLEQMSVKEVCAR